MKDNVNYFKERVNYYFFDFFKMYEYELTISSQDKFASRASTYWHSFDEGAQMITICYTEDWISEKDITKKEIDKVAFHEVCEAFLSELNQLIQERFITEDNVNRSIHKVIRKLENILFPLISEK
jgi:hypothetical protein